MAGGEKWGVKRGGTGMKGGGAVIKRAFEYSAEGLPGRRPVYVGVACLPRRPSIALRVARAASHTPPRKWATRTCLDPTKSSGLSPISTSAR